MVGSNIKFYRKKANLTQKELGDLIGKGKSNISMYESSDRLPPIDVLVKLCKVLNVSVSTLLGIKDNAETAYNNSPDLPELSEGEKAIVDIFRLIPKEQQKHFLEMGRVFADSLKKD